MKKIKVKKNKQSGGNGKDLTSKAEQEIKNMLGAVEQLKVTAPQMLKMLEESTITNMHLKVMNDAVVQEISDVFEDFGTRLGALEEMVYGAAQGKIKLEGPNVEKMKLAEDMREKLRTNLEKLKETIDKAPKSS